MTKAHTVQTTAKEGYLLAGYYASVQAAMVNIYVEVRKSQISSWQSADNFLKFLAVTPAYRYAPALPNLYDFAYDGSLERSLVLGGEMFQSGQISFSSHLPWRSAEMGSPFGGIMAYER